MRLLLVNFSQICALDCIYGFILIRSTLGSLLIIFGTFVRELWPLIDVRISFLLNNFRTNGHTFTKFYICIYIDKIYIVIHFRSIF